MLNKLNNDVLVMIFEELRGDRNSLYSCLSVNKVLCNIIVSILWKDPWKYMVNGKEGSLFNVIISLLPDGSKRRLMSQGINLFTALYQRPLFNYISFCRNLCLDGLSQIVYTSNIREASKRLIVKEEMLKLFINNNTRITRLSLSDQLEDPIHLIFGAEQCFSELEYLKCSTSTNQNILEGFSKISKSIKKLEFNCSSTHCYNSGIVKLIETQKSLCDVISNSTIRDESFFKALEESLMIRASTIQSLKIGWEPVTRVLSHLVNLISLEINSLCNTSWSHLGSVSIPTLKVLKAQNIPSNILANFIENTKGFLTEISVQYSIRDREFNKYDRGDNIALIRSIRRNCLHLKYLKLSIRNDDISELENLFINCKFLNGLILNSSSMEDLNWEMLFKVLTKSAPHDLHKFKFIFENVSLETFKVFLDNWQNRKPILLKIFYRMDFTLGHMNLINEYEERKIIKMFSANPAEFCFNEFEWVFNTFS